MGHFQDEMGRLKSAMGMGFWIFLLAWLGVWMARKGWWMMGHDWVWTGLGMALLGVLICVMSLRGIWLVLMLLLGRTNPRLARRDFRNTLSNFVMFAKSGMWKE